MATIRPSRRNRKTSPARKSLPVGLSGVLTQLTSCARGFGPWCSATLQGVKENTTTNHSRFVSPARLAEIFEVSVRTVQRWQAEGVLRGYKLAGGRAVRFHLDEAERAILGRVITKEEA